MSFLKKIVEWIRSFFWSSELELSIVGLQNAGKTTLMNTLATGKFDKDTIPTIGYNYRTLRKGNVQIKLWDLGGQPRFRESWEKYCRDADCIVYVVDGSDLGSIDIARTQLHQLLSWPSLSGIPLLVLSNKNDLRSFCLDKEELIQHLDLKSIVGRKVCTYSISAKNAVNLDVTMKWLAELPKRQK